MLRRLPYYQALPALRQSLKVMSKQLLMQSSLKATPKLRRLSRGLRRCLKRFATPCPKKQTLNL